MGNVVPHATGKVSARVPGACVVCDDCGRVFTVTQEISSGTDKRKRCERCAARICEEKVAHCPNARKCSNCQAIFSVTARMADLSPSVTVNCQRCSEAHRQMIQTGAYLEVILQRGDEKLYICCPRSLQTELRRCITTGKQQGYNMLGSPEDTIME